MSTLTIHEAESKLSERIHKGKQLREKGLVTNEKNGEKNMATVTIQEAQATLSDLIHRLAPGEEVVITENNQPVARLVQSPAPQPKLRQLGTMKGTVLSMAADFDAPLEDFKEYME